MVTHDTLQYGMIRYNRSCSAPVNLEKEAMFASVIESIYDRHSSTLITMAKGTIWYALQINDFYSIIKDVLEMVS